MEVWHPNKPPDVCHCLCFMELQGLTNLTRLNNLLSVVGLRLSQFTLHVPSFNLPLDGQYLAKIRHLLVSQLPVVCQSVTAPHWACMCFESPTERHFQYTCFNDLESYSDTRQWKGGGASASCGSPWSPDHSSPRAGKSSCPNHINLYICTC
jgi:hypothetical protein